MKVLKIVDQPDGSALVDLDMSEEERNLLLQFAFTELIKKYIDENPPAPNLENSESEEEFSAEGTTRSHNEDE
jgi:hypothetical protein